MFRDSQRAPRLFCFRQDIPIRIGKLLRPLEVRRTNPIGITHKKCPARKKARARCDTSRGLDGFGTRFGGDRRICRSI